MFSKRYAWIMPALIAVSCLCGCKTDAMFANRHRPDGPVTSRERPEGVELPDIIVIDAKEVDLVEAVLTHRAEYYRSLKVLRDYYERHGYHAKRMWASDEVKGVERIKPYKYIVDAEIPMASLRPVDSIPEADALYTKGRELLMQGGHRIPALYREDLMIESLRTFTELITKYPTSDKIDDAAFYCGEITKEYLKDQEEIALRWYERAWTWDPKTPHPARFQAAVVYDYRLHDRARALELYQSVLKLEANNKSNAAFAMTRIHFLTRDLKVDAEKSGPSEAESAPAESEVAKSD